MGIGDIEKSLNLNGAVSNASYSISADVDGTWPPGLNNCRACNNELL